MGVHHLGHQVIATLWQFWQIPAGLQGILLLGAFLKRVNRACLVHNLEIGLCCLGEFLRLRAGDFCLDEAIGGIECEIQHEGRVGILEGKAFSLFPRKGPAIQWLAILHISHLGPQTTFHRLEDGP